MNFDIPIPHSDYSLSASRLNLLEKRTMFVLSCFQVRRELVGN